MGGKKKSHNFLAGPGSQLFVDACPSGCMTSARPCAHPFGDLEGECVCVCVRTKMRTCAN